jgi:DNA-directed RNA polymerase specialized sigma24 family protein
MCLAWHEIRDQLTASSTTFKFQRDFDTFQRSQVALTPYNDPAAVLDALHCKSADPDKKNRVLSALVMAAQGDDPAAPDTVVQCRCDLFRLLGEDAGLVRAVVLHGFSQVEVAAVLGISPDAARKRYQRALRRLRKVFENNFDGAVP